MQVGQKNTKDGTPATQGDSRTGLAAGYDEMVKMFGVKVTQVYRIAQRSKQRRTTVANIANVLLAHSSML